MSEKLLWCDTETGGLDFNKNGIISLALIAEIDGKIEGKEYFEMNPVGTEIEQGALEVNGFTLEQIQSFRPREQVRQDILAFMKEFVSPYKKEDKFLLAGQNVIFDSNMMKSYFEHCGDPYWFSWVQAGKFIDTYQSLAFLQWAGKIPQLENSKLETLGKHFDLNTENLHNAMDDIVLTRAVAYKMKELLRWM
jgi:DNA polymerase III epsilon subunit-like protein